MSHTVADDKKLFLRDKCVVGAKKYKDYLMDKDFLVICEDGNSTVVRFFAKDFIHLTGIKSNLTEKRFFDNCYDKTLAIGNIDKNQHYNWDTLKSKAVRIEMVDQIVYGKTENSLFMVNLHTHTGDFPYAIRNSDINTCIGFKGSINKARTLRKYSNSADADNQKKILAIFSKMSANSIYDNLIYLENIEELLCKKNDLLSLISDDLKQKIISEKVE